jgi:DUF1365 family protein
MRGVRHRRFMHPATVMTLLPAILRIPFVNVTILADVNVAARRLRHEGVRAKPAVDSDHAAAA